MAMDLVLWMRTVQTATAEVATYMSTLFPVPARTVGQRDVTQAPEDMTYGLQYTICWKRPGLASRH